MRVVIAVVSVCILVVSGAPVDAGDKVDCAQPYEVDLIGTVCDHPDGLFEVLDEDGRSLGTVHGVDEPGTFPAAEGDQEGAAGADGHTFLMPLGAPPRPAECVPLGTPYSMRVVYARSASTPDRYNEMVDEIREMVEIASGYMGYSAAPSGIGVNLRVQCSGGQVDVAHEVLPGQGSFGSIVSDLQNVGYTDGKIKHAVWYDEGEFQSCGGGVGHIYNDDRPGTNNWNNGNGAPLFGVTFNCRGALGGEILLHENSHNMGAVQLSAPHSTGAFHCTDGWDIMCYNDGGSQSGQYSTGHCDTVGYDCGNDDYFHPDPAPGSYLADNWNVGGQNNRFITRDACPLLEWGTLTLGTPFITGDFGPALAVFGVNAVDQDIPSACWGYDFELLAYQSSADFDICWKDTNGADIQCMRTAGDETGTIPSGATTARIWHWSGVDSQWILFAL